MENNKSGIDSIISLAMDKLKNSTDVNCIIGDKIEIDGLTLIPISKVSAGYIAGGGEYNELKKKENPLVSGGSGGGYGVKPIGFLKIKNGDATMIPIDATAGIETIIEIATKVINCFKVKGDKKKK